jgi:MOSC domain-containing protein YiiM
MEPRPHDVVTTPGLRHTGSVTVVAPIPLTDEQLRAGLDEVRAAPGDGGEVRLIVRRPAVDARETLAEGELDIDVGLVGDTWLERAGRSSLDGSPARHAQVTLMNARYAALIAGDRERWAEAGDQLYVDLDLSVANLPAGTHIAIGTAVLRISEEPHTGCAKFSARFGSPAWRLANSEEGRALRLRGANATVVESGLVREGDVVRKA